MQRTGIVFIFQCVDFSGLLPLDLCIHGTICVYPEQLGMTNFLSKKFQDNCEHSLSPTITI